MNLEDLIVLAGAKGIDLKQIAGAVAPAYGPSVRKRRLTKDERKQANGRPVLESVRGHQTRVARRPAWSSAELGQAAGGVPRLPWLAVQFSWAGDRSSETYWELYEGLRAEAEMFRRDFSWPYQIVGADGLPRFYLEALVQLVLDEDQHQHVFAAVPDSKLYAAYLHVEPHVWRGKLFERFDRVKCVYLSWIETARAMIQRKLSSRELVDEAI